MPRRADPLIKSGVYHVFNKTINSQAIFENDNYCFEFIERIKYYRSKKSRVSYSHLKDLEPGNRNHLLESVLIKNHYRVEIYCYTLMPTHFHFLLRQKQEDGIKEFISNTLNSLTKYRNIKNNKLGPLFLPRFKAVPISSDEVAKHISRYIHLNYFSSGLVRSIEELETYPWSSYKAYISDKDDGICDKGFILNLFVPIGPLI